MVERGLSTRARLVLDEATTGPNAVTEGISLGRIQRILKADDAKVAEVVVLELDAAGYIRNHGEGKRIRIRASAVDPDMGRFTRAIEVMAAEVVDLMPPLDSGEAGGSWGAGPVAAPPSTRRADEWVAAEGVRAQTMLAIAIEHGWYSIVCSVADPLARLWHAAGRLDDARATLEMGFTAERRRCKERLAELHMSHAGVLSDQNWHDNAESAATAAVVCAWEAGKHGLVAAAYDSRAAVRERGGKPAWAMEDRELALIAARQDGRPEQSADLLTGKAERADARYVAAMRSLQSAVAELAGPGTPINTDLLLALLTEAMGDLRHADPAGLHIARLLQTVREILPGIRAAEIAEMAGHVAQRHALHAVARACFQQAADLYEGGGRREQADRVGELLTRLGRAGDGHGVIRSE
jgi:hypothetical protein